MVDNVMEYSNDLGVFILTRTELELILKIVEDHGTLEDFQEASYEDSDEMADKLKKLLGK